jgi:hypothetical protein
MTVDIEEMPSYIKEMRIDKDVISADKEEMSCYIDAKRFDTEEMRADTREMWKTGEKKG